MAAANNIAIIVFPHSTERIAAAIADSLAKGVNESGQTSADESSNISVTNINITPHAKREASLTFGADDIVIVGTPTYAGRVPNKIMPYFRDGIKGSNTLAVILVTYGNRAYDDSMKELSELMTNNGFIVIAAAAFVCQHSFTSKLATGRPDEEDIKKASDFGISVSRSFLDSDGNIDDLKLDLSSVPGRTIAETEYYKPVKTDGKPAAFLKAMPKTDASKCNHCGKCSIVCPMNCFANDCLTPEGTCIKCMACIADCPNNAKFFTDEDLAGHRKMLEDNFANVHREPEFYI